jgi:hypothetical protein
MFEQFLDYFWMMLDQFVDVDVPISFGRSSLLVDFPRIKPKSSWGFANK